MPRVLPLSVAYIRPGPAWPARRAGGRGCTRIVAGKVTGACRRCEPLDKVLDRLRAGEALVVTRLDRLARSPRDLIDVIAIIDGMNLKLQAQPFADTTSPAGHMMLTVFAGVAEFERLLILSRTRAGREAVKPPGVRWGRKPVLIEAPLPNARTLMNDPDPQPVSVIAEMHGVHKIPLYRALRAAEPADARP